jgi:hypothetical protein
MHLSNRDLILFPTVVNCLWQDIFEWGIWIERSVTLFSVFKTDPLVRHSCNKGEDSEHTSSVCIMHHNEERTRLFIRDMDMLHAYSVIQCKYPVRWPFDVLSLPSCCGLLRMCDAYRHYVMQSAYFTSNVKFLSDSLQPYSLYVAMSNAGRSQWPHVLRHELSSLARTLGSWVPIPLEAWMSVLCAFILFVLFCK